MAMALSDYPARRLVDIKLRAAKIASVPLDELARLDRVDSAAVALLDDGLRTACDELAVQADIRREQP